MHISYCFYQSVIDKANIDELRTRAKCAKIERRENRNFLDGRLFVRALKNVKGLYNLAYQWRIQGRVLTTPALKQNKYLYTE